MRPHVGLGCYLDIRVPEFEDDLWLPRGETLCVRNASAQDECVFVQSEVFGIDEQNFPDLKRGILEIFRGKFHAALIGRRRSTFANLNKLWRDVNLLGLRISLH